MLKRDKVGIFPHLATVDGTKALAVRSSSGRMIVADKIVSVGLLTQRDLDVLGTSFTRHFPVPRDNAYDDLLRRLDQVDFSHDVAAHVRSR